MRALGIGAFVSLTIGASSIVATAQQEPTIAVRETAMKSLVYIRASNCADGSERVGSGFALNRPGTIVTAHHVVGGCQTIRVEFESVVSPAPRLRTANVERVYASGDLALLTVDSPPSIPVLALAPPPPERGRSYIGFGYQNGQRTAGDQLVTFSTGSTSLRDVLPDEAIQELARAGSKINLNNEILRFNVALQPGMSGGPIINSDGRVIGVVAGGLKAGAATASWGWPSEWIPKLLASNELIDQEVKIARSYYSLNEMRRDAAAIDSGRRIRCGALDFVFRGKQKFSEVARGADDQPRLQYILNASTLPRSEIDQYEFDIWVHIPSGATAVTPAGYPVTNEGDVCILRSSTGPFRQVIWSAAAGDANQVQMASIQFEQQVMFPRAPYMFGYNFDFVLTTLGAQPRDNGMLFNRKGFTQPKIAWYQGNPPPPSAHTFETLISKGGSFLGVGTLNDDLPGNLSFCVQTGATAPGCATTIQHLREWTKFILATQISTYPPT
jgi:S1-C subfamily serine protease